MEMGMMRSLCELAFCSAQIGGSGVLVQPMTYIFDEEPERWQKVLDAVNTH